MLSIQKIKSREVKESMPELYNDYTVGAHLIYDGGKVLGQVVSYVNPYIGMDTLLLGGYKMCDQLEVGCGILKQVITEAKATGFKKILGPMNGSTWDSYRFAEPSAAKPFLLEPEAKVHFIEQWESAGFEKEFSYYSSITEMQNKNQWINKERQLEAYFTSKNISIEKWKSNFSVEQWLQLVEFNNQAFEKNPLFSPITKNRFKEKYSTLLKHIDTQFMYFVKQGKELVGLLFAYPNLANTESKSLVLKTMARLPKAELKGLGTWLATKLHNEALTNGYQKIIHALMHADNASTIRSNEFEGKVFRNYSLYKMDL